MSTATDPSPTATAERERPLPWWRFGIVWMVLGGPIAVVVASLVTAVIAWRHIDPVITPARSGASETRAADDMAEPADLKNPMAPAMKARNHAASPQR